jgi:hypothetical protein
LLAVVGLKDVVVSATEDAVLVISKEYAQTVKDIVEHLKRNGRRHTLDHLKVYRPWGGYQALNRGTAIMKCIMVKPGGTRYKVIIARNIGSWSRTLEVTKGDWSSCLQSVDSTSPGEKHHRQSRQGSRPS